MLTKIDKLRTSYLNKRLIFLADLFISVFSSASILLIVNLVSSSEMYAGKYFLFYVGMSAVVSALLIYFSRCYRIIIRHLNIRDLGVFASVNMLKCILLVVLVSLSGRYDLNLWLITFCDFLLTFVLMVCIRLVMILTYEFILRRSRVSDNRKILVYGITEKSVATILRLQHSPHFEVVGFIVHGQQGSDTIIERIPVFGFTELSDLPRIFDRSGASGVLFARSVEAQSEEESLIGYCNRNGLKTLIVPGVDEVKEGDTILHPREIKVEDLLGRDEIKINMDAIKENFSGKVVMVTGAAGSIGSELCRQLSGFGVNRLILFDNAETPMHNLRLELEGDYPDLDFVPVIGDVRQKERLDFAFRTYRPQVVFHAAAYKHVPLMEENPCEAVLVNVIGSRQVADKCREYGVEKMVMISTDKAVNPTNVMGCTKRLAEIYVQSLGLALENGQEEGKTVFVTTRFGNVLGSNGSVIPRFREQIASGGPVTVTHPDINRFFMTIPEACRLVMEAATMARCTSIFVFDMGSPVKIDTLARRMITLAGFVPDRDIKVEYTGLRPGEKLYEEVLSNNENTLPTSHDRIRVAKVREYDHSDARDAVDKLEGLSRDVEIPQVVRQMKVIVPEYLSTDNSPFCRIDEDLVREGVRQ